MDLCMHLYSQFWKVKFKIVCCVSMKNIYTCMYLNQQPEKAIFYSYSWLCIHNGSVLTPSLHHWQLNTAQDRFKHTIESLQGELDMIRQHHHYLQNQLEAVTKPKEPKPPSRVGLRPPGKDPTDRSSSVDNFGKQSRLSGKGLCISFFPVVMASEYKWDYWTLTWHFSYNVLIYGHSHWHREYQDYSISVVILLRKYPYAGSFIILLASLK